MFERELIPDLVQMHTLDHLHEHKSCAHDVIGIGIDKVRSRYWNRGVLADILGRGDFAVQNGEMLSTISCKSSNTAPSIFKVQHADFVIGPSWQTSDLNALAMIA